MVGVSGSSPPGRTILPFATFRIKSVLTKDFSNYHSNYVKAKFNDLSIKSAVVSGVSGACSVFSSDMFSLVSVGLSNRFKAIGLLLRSEISH